MGPPDWRCPGVQRGPGNSLPHCWGSPSCFPAHRTKAWRRGDRTTGASLKGSSWSPCHKSAAGKEKPFAPASPGSECCCCSRSCWGHCSLHETRTPTGNKSGILTKWFTAIEPSKEKKKRRFSPRSELESFRSLAQGLLMGFVGVVAGCLSSSPFSLPLFASASCDSFFLGRSLMKSRSAPGRRPLWGTQHYCAHRKDWNHHI